MAPTLQVGVGDCSPFVLWGDRSHDVTNPDRISPQFGGNTAFIDGQPWVRDAAGNKVWSVPLLLQARPALTQYTNRVTNPSFEVDTAGWVTNAPGFWINAGATLTRVTTQAAPGTASGQVVTTNAASFEGTTFSLGVLPAGTYSFSLNVRGNAGGEAIQVLGGLASASGTTVATALTTSWQRVSGTFAADGVGTCYIGVRDTSAVVMTFFIDGALVVAGSTLPPYFDGSLPGCAWTGTANASTSTSPTATLNLTTNPSFEVDTSGWAAINAGVALTRDTTLSYAGAASLKVTTDGSGSSQGIQTSPITAIGAQASATYTFSAFVYGSVGGEQINVRVRTLDAGSAALDETVTNVTLVKGWQFISATRAASAGACYVIGQIRTQATQGITIYVDAACLSPDTGAIAYFDGDSLDANWTGTAHASTSVALAGSDGVSQMVRDLNGLLSQGALVKFQPQGASLPTYFDLERGRLDPHWDLYEDNAGVLRATLNLWTRPWGHTGTTRLVASQVGTGPQVLSATGILGDVTAYANLEVQLGSAANLPSALYAVGFGVAKSASYNPLPVASFMPSTLGTVVGGSGAVGSQWVSVDPGAPAFGFGAGNVPLINFTLTPPAAHVGRHRLFAVMRHKYLPATAQVNMFVGIANPAAATANWLPHTATTTLATGNASQWFLVDLGEISVPTAPSGMFDQQFVIQANATGVGSRVATPALELNQLILTPLDTSAGLVFGMASIAVGNMPSLIAVDSWPQARTYRASQSGVPNRYFTDSQTLRGDFPRLPPTGSPVATGPLKIVTFAGQIYNFVGNDQTTVKITALERFSYLR